MDIEKLTKKVNSALDSKEMVQDLEQIEINAEVFEVQMACLQYFSYILTWDIVNARFFYYKYQRILEQEVIGKELTKFLKLIFEDRHSQLLEGCDKLCELLSTHQEYKKWLDELRNRVSDHLKNVVQKNFNSISAARLSSYGVNPQGKSYVKIEEKQQENPPINIEKLSQMARLIQNMENK